MKNQIKLGLMVAWLAGAVAILLMGTSMCASSDEACVQSGASMFLFMFWFSFPSSLLFGVAALIFADAESIHYPSEFIIAWMVMVSGGLLQWFVLVPRLFHKRELIVLDLKPCPAPMLDSDKNKTSALLSLRPMPAALTAPQPLASQSLKPMTIPVSQNKRRPTKVKPFVAFDRRGRSPLERVIDVL